MSLYDIVKVKLNLPVERSIQCKLKKTNFQTKDFDCNLETFLINSNGDLYEVINVENMKKSIRFGSLVFNWNSKTRGTETKRIYFHGAFDIHTVLDGERYEFRLIYVDGKVINTKRI